jgi:transcriptional regulator GlxA family with amidase domain
VTAAGPPQRVGVLVFPEVEELDFVGPWEMLRSWGRYLGGPQECFIVAQSTAPLRCALGLQIVPDHDFATCPPLDVLLVPGGPGTRREVSNPALVDFVARQGHQAQALLSVCTGAFVLHAAGLLGGRKATTHWASLQRLRDLGDVQVCEERWVQDGRIWCSAGVSAGIDMALAFIAEQAGEAVAGKVQLGAEYYPEGTRWGGMEHHPQAPAYLRPGGQE